MGRDRNRGRLEKIENSLTPKELVASWIQDFAKFDSADDYMSWIFEDVSRAPLPKMLQQLESSITKRPDGRGKNSSDKNSSRELLRNKQCELLFLANLVLKANAEAYYLLDQKEFRAAIIDGVQAVNESVSSLRAMLELLGGLANTPYPLDINTAAAVQSALKNEIIGIDDLAREIVDRRSNDSADQVASEEAPSETCKRLKREIQDLCRRGLVKRGSRVRLGPTPVGFLSEPPLVDGVWIDRVAVELAEFAAVLSKRGIRLEEPADPHPLAPLRPRRRRASAGEPKAGDLEDEIADAYAKAAARLLRFTGRTREIDARPYIHLDDYRAWSEREAGDALEVTKGVATASWNAWVEASGNCPELTGIRVSKLESGLEDKDFFPCADPKCRRRRDEMASKIRTLISTGASKYELGVQLCRVGTYHLLIEVRAIVTATERLTARYFRNLKILFGSYANALNELNASATRLVEDYNKLADIAANQNRIFGAKFRRRIKKIGKNATDQAADQAAEERVATLIALAKAEMLLSFGENEKAVEILEPLVTGEVD